VVPVAFQFLENPSSWMQLPCSIAVTGIGGLGGSGTIVSSHNGRVTQSGEDYGPYLNDCR